MIRTPKTGVDGHLASPFAFSHRLYRAVWSVFYMALFRYSPTPFFFWRRLLLRAFGAKIADGAKVYPSVKIWYPANLVMAKDSAIGPDVDIYCMDIVYIGERATISQKAFICGGGHDIYSKSFDLVVAPIHIGSHAWVAADTYVAMGVTIGDWAVVGARSSVFRDIPACSIAVGTPAKVVGKRVVRT